MMDRNVRLLVSYDGTDFCGWQVQPGLRTVQGVLQDALRRVLRHDVGLIGSGRTDSGVHAVGQVANVLTNCPMPVDKLRSAVGDRLPQDVGVLGVRDVSREFHATRSATSKLYRYIIYNWPGRPVSKMSQRYAYHHWRPLDLDAMRRAGDHFVGRKDFRAVACSRCDRQNTVRSVFRCDIDRYYEEVRIDVEGSGFLYHQVRNMVGTLIEVGRGHWQPQRVADILESRDRTRAGPTAPAHGLCLQWVRYPAHLLRPDVSLLDSDTTPWSSGDG